MSKYFGTDGFRGEANVVLTSEHAWKIGRFLGWYYGKAHKPKIVIGKDTRISSYTLEYALAAGLTASGADAYILHVTTTPSVSYVTRFDHFDCGIMISASHNPYYDNGIKLINSNGEKMEDETIEALENYLDEGQELPFAAGENVGIVVDYVAGRNRYIGYLISLATVSYRGKRVGLDCANGSAYMIAQNVFNALGADTYIIHNHPDGFNINRDAGSTHIERLQEYVLRNKLDIGFAFDGDADRCIAVDEKGNAVDGDAILYMMSKYLKSRGQLDHNTVVTTVMSNFGLYKALEAEGISYEKTAVGDKYVYECMAKNGFRLGGEQSGHIIFSKYANTGDGILTAISMMELLCSEERPLSELTAGFQPYPQVLLNVRVKDKAAALQDEAVLAAVEAQSRILGDTGRMLVRASGTEPMVRVMAEAETKERCLACVNTVVAVMKERGLCVE